jgi:hypothetical protein
MALNGGCYANEAPPIPRDTGKNRFTERDAITSQAKENVALQ